MVHFGNTLFFTYFDDLVRGRIRSNYNDFFNLRKIKPYQSYLVIMTKLFLKQLFDVCWNMNDVSHGPTFNGQLSVKWAQADKTYFIKHSVKTILNILFFALLAVPLSSILASVLKWDMLNKYVQINIIQAVMLIRVPT